MSFIKAVGGGRGTGIGAASGGVLGGLTGVANVLNAAGYAPQQFNAYYRSGWRSAHPRRHRHGPMALGRLMPRRKAMRLAYLAAPMI
jgi:hypothetical protein